MCGHFDFCECWRACADCHRLPRTFVSWTFADNRLTFVDCPSTFVDCRELFVLRALSAPRTRMDRSITSMTPIE
eukprot:6208910-Pleurochrysis_carterae.AAC.1